MPGIYIHIPFCKQKCSYCDFHFSTNRRQEDEMVRAICLEIEKKRFFLGDHEIKTIYFGGGSPSFIQSQNLAKILAAIQKFFNVISEPEITVECNPDDIDDQFLSSMKAIDVNRISIGVQSFFDDDLKLLNRAHNGNMAYDAIRKIQDFGFDNITLDLIYGLPQLNHERWAKNIDLALGLNIPHISSYCLTVEDKTLLKHQLEKGKIQLPNEEEQSSQFKYLVTTLTDAGFDHYEISNFAKSDFISKHNSSYWKNENYLGFGPSAHSKIDNKRFWNISNNNQYIKGIMADQVVYEEEKLSEQDLFNEILMIGLRTKWGVDLKELQRFSFYDLSFKKELNQLIQEKKIKVHEDRIYIEGANKFIADTIISNLFIV